MRYFSQMKLTHRLTICLILLLFLISCTEEGNDPEKISGILEFTEGSTEFAFSDASEVVAIVTIVGGGGGGGGGSAVRPNIVVNPLPGLAGGGGGGAGESLTVREVSFPDGLTFKAIVGAGGQGGGIDNNGTNGSSSRITGGQADIIIVSAEGGKGGESGSYLEEGKGGEGNPPGASGKEGSGNEPEGADGGAGGDNGSSYGNGGAGGGGEGADDDANPASAGQGGERGYIRIEWEGVRK